jgi:hypothetical protein
MTLAEKLLMVWLTPVANLLLVSTTLAGIAGKFPAGIVDTGGAP